MIRRLFALATAIVVAAATVAGVSVWVWLRPDLRRLDELVASAKNAPVHARVIRAILAIEDPRHFQRSGLPTVSSLAHAALLHSSSSRRVYCASTLTDQLVRMTLPPQRAATRVIKEVMLTSILDARGRPDDVAQAYARLICLGRTGGRTVVGVRDAAQVYFGRSAEDLSPAQIATLVSAIPQPFVCSPSATSPAVIDRRLRVLAVLRERRVITADELEIASRAVTRREI